MDISFNQVYDAYHSAKSFDDVTHLDLHADPLPSQDELFDRLGQRYAFSPGHLSAADHAEIIKGAFENCPDLKRGKKLLEDFKRLENKLRPQGLMATLTSLFSSRAKDYETIHAARKEAKAAFHQQVLKENSQLKSAFQGFIQLATDDLDAIPGVLEKVEGVRSFEELMTAIASALPGKVQEGTPVRLQEYAFWLVALRPHSEIIDQKRALIQKSFNKPQKQILDQVIAGLHGNTLNASVDETQLKTVLRVITQFVARDKGHILEALADLRSSANMDTAWDAIRFTDEAHIPIAKALAQAAGLVTGKSPHEGIEALAKFAADDIKATVEQIKKGEVSGG